MSTYTYTIKNKVRFDNHCYGCPCIRRGNCLLTPEAYWALAKIVGGWDVLDAMAGIKEV